MPVGYKHGKYNRKTNRVKVQKYKGSVELELRVGKEMNGVRCEFNWSGGDCMSGRGCRPRI